MESPTLDGWVGGSPILGNHHMLVGGDWNMTFMFQYFGNNHEESSQLTIIFFRAFETVCMCMYMKGTQILDIEMDGWIEIEIEIDIPR